LFAALRRAPSPTLFPYTTLFRSDAMGVDAAVLAALGAPLQPALIDQPADELDGAVFGEQRRVERDLVDPVHDVARRGRHVAAFEDRKSTRLNSSHQIISYAVFCL